MVGIGEESGLQLSGEQSGNMPGPAELHASDIRRTMPRFQADEFAQNTRLLAPLADIAGRVGCTPAQLSLAWVLAKGDHVIVIPGTTKVSHLEENQGAGAVRLDAATVEELDALFRPGTVAGERYPPATQAENDTEDFVQRG